jgi:hypothetical protein
LIRRRPLVPLVLGVGTLITPIGFFVIDPAHEQAPVYRSLGLFSATWHAFFVVGALLIIAGWYERRIDYEAAGYVISATGACIYVIAAFAVRGWAAWTAGVLILTLAGAQIGRAVSMMRGVRP